LRNKAIAFCGFNGVSGLMAHHLRQQICLGYLVQGAGAKKTRDGVFSEG
jgi:hypothetical protein